MSSPREERSATEEMLWHEEWRSERSINLFRFVIWSAVCVLLITADQLAGNRFNFALVMGLGYGLACGIASATWLRTHYHRAVPFVATTCDMVGLGVLANYTQGFLEQTQAPLATYNLYILQAPFLLLLVPNALRFSWKVTAWSVLSAVVVYGTVLWINGMDQLSTIMFAMVLIVAVGAILGYASIKLRRVIRRVEERNALARFLPGPIVDQVTEDPSRLKLGGAKLEATVLFTDIRDFTTISEGLDPADVVDLLNEYFDEMVAEIFEHQGILDKFIGDGICAVFAPPLEHADQAERAIRCARGMLQRLKRINAARTARGAPALRIGIGIHSGTLVAGNVGSAMRMEYTHIGDTVNTASRIEGMTKKLGVPLLVSRETYEQASALEVDAEDLGRHELKGRPEPVELFSIN